MLIKLQLKKNLSNKKRSAYRTKLKTSLSKVKIMQFL